MKAISKVKQNVYDSMGKQESNRFISAEDICEIGAILPSLLIEITYPSGNTMRKAYVKSLEGFTLG